MFFYLIKINFFALKIIEKILNYSCCCLMVNACLCSIEYSFMNGLDAAIFKLYIRGS